MSINSNIAEYNMNLLWFRATLHLANSLCELQSVQVQCNHPES